jgi:hypothetical protein
VEHRDTGNIGQNTQNEEKLNKIQHNKETKLKKILQAINHRGKRRDWNRGR